MLKKLLFIFFLIFLSQMKAQDEFITTWKPSLAPPSYPYTGIAVNSSNNQIWFPGRGTDYQIYWEEIGFPSHHATLTNVNSAYQLLIDFGTSLNPNPSDATYRVKVSKAGGNFNQFRFADWDLFTDNGLVGDVHKILKVEQWGNIQWTSMKQAFQGCKLLDITATDIPKLSDVTDMSNMFSGCYALMGNPTMNDWDVSNVTTLQATFSGCYVFNQPIGDWDTSKVTLMLMTFSSAKAFNQPLENWNTSKVQTMALMFDSAKEFNQNISNWDVSSNTNCTFMFSDALKFDQPIGNWNMSNVVSTSRMFSNAKAFNQDISNWNTGKVTNMGGMFAGAENFNKNIGNWDVSKVESMSDLFNNANSFNQNIGQWNLSSLQFATNIFKNSAINCQNYDSILQGWSLNPATPDNINISPVSPLTYSHPLAVNARNYLISNKNWTITGDNYDGECQSFLAVTDFKTKENEVNIYPNPATDFIYVKNSDKAKNYTIFDQNGRIIIKDNFSTGKINIQSLTTGNYILQIVSEDKIQNFKFIKK